MDIRLQIEYLEHLADIYSSRDRVRFDELMAQIKALEIKLLDMMVEGAKIR